MSDEQRVQLTSWVDLIFKVGTPVGFVILFFLRSSFATREEVAAQMTRLDRIENAISIMAEQNQTNVRQDQRIADFELRLRALEFGRK